MTLKLSAEGTTPVSTPEAIQVNSAVDVKPATKQGRLYSSSSTAVSRESYFDALNPTPHAGRANDASTPQQPYVRQGMLLAQGTNPPATAVQDPQLKGNAIVTYPPRGPNTALTPRRIQLVQNPETTQAPGTYQAAEKLLFFPTLKQFGVTGFDSTTVATVFAHEAFDYSRERPTLIPEVKTQFLPDGISNATSVFTTKNGLNVYGNLITRYQASLASYAATAAIDYKSPEMGLAIVNAAQRLQYNQLPQSEFDTFDKEQQGRIGSIAKDLAQRAKDEEKKLATRLPSQTPEEAEKQKKFVAARNATIVNPIPEPGSTPYPGGKLTAALEQPGIPKPELYDRPLTPQEISKLKTEIALREDAIIDSDVTAIIHWDKKTSGQFGADKIAFYSQDQALNDTKSAPNSRFARLERKINSTFAAMGVDSAQYISVVTHYNKKGGADTLQAINDAITTPRLAKWSVDRRPNRNLGIYNKPDQNSYNAPWAPGRYKDTYGQLVTAEGIRNLISPSNANPYYGGSPNIPGTQGIGNASPGFGESIPDVLIAR